MFGTLYVLVWSKRRHACDAEYSTSIVSPQSLGAKPEPPFRWQWNFSPIEYRLEIRGHFRLKHIAGIRPNEEKFSQR